jgi:hypothetical protein
MEANLTCQFQCKLENNSIDLISINSNQSLGKASAKVSYRQALVYML